MDEKNWYKISEKSAGELRLKISWYLYKISGTNILLVISFFVALVSFIVNKDVRSYSKKYFKTVSDYFNEPKLKPSLINEFKHVLSFANSLVYKLEVFGDTFKFEKIKYADDFEAEKMYEKMKAKKGMIFIFPHIGNIEIMRALLLNKNQIQPVSVSIFMQKDHCKVFRNFMEKIEKTHDTIKVYPIEDIDLSTVSEIDDNLKEGGIVFIAGDRIAPKNPQKTFNAKLFNKTVLFPSGAFKTVKILNYDTYFISCLKEKNAFKIYLEEQTEKNEKELMKKFAVFMEKLTKIAPYQFYHFYDIFVDG